MKKLKSIFLSSLVGASVIALASCGGSDSKKDDDESKEIESGSNQGTGESGSSQGTGDSEAINNAASNFREFYNEDIATLFKNLTSGKYINVKGTTTTRISQKTADNKTVEKDVVNGGSYSVSYKDGAFNGFSSDSYSSYSSDSYTKSYTILSDSTVKNVDYEYEDNKFDNYDYDYDDLTQDAVFTPLDLYNILTSDAVQKLLNMPNAEQLKSYVGTLITDMTPYALNAVDSLFSSEEVAAEDNDGVSGTKYYFDKDKFREVIGKEVVEGSITYKATIENIVANLFGEDALVSLENTAADVILGQSSYGVLNDAFGLVKTIAPYVNPTVGLVIDSFAKQSKEDIVGSIDSFKGLPIPEKYVSMADMMIDAYDLSVTFNDNKSVSFYFAMPLTDEDDEPVIVDGKLVMDEYELTADFAKDDEVSFYVSAQGQSYYATISKENNSFNLEGGLYAKDDDNVLKTAAVTATLTFVSDKEINLSALVTSKGTIKANLKLEDEGLNFSLTQKSYNKGKLQTTNELTALVSSDKIDFEYNDYEEESHDSYTQLSQKVIGSVTFSDEVDKDIKNEVESNYKSPNDELSVYEGKPCNASNNESVTVTYNDGALTFSSKDFKSSDKELPYYGQLKSTKINVDDASDADLDADGSAYVYFGANVFENLYAEHKYGDITVVYKYEDGKFVGSYALVNGEKVAYSTISSKIDKDEEEEVLDDLNNFDYIYKVELNYNVK